MASPLVLVSNRVKNLDQYQQEYVDDLAPRLDYIEIAQQLGGEISGYNLFNSIWYSWGRKIEKSIKLDLIESIHTTFHLSRHNVVLSSSEKAAIPLAMFLSLVRRRMPHIVIAHHLSSINKIRLFRVWKLYHQFTHIICVCTAQADYAVKQLGIPPANVDFIYDKVDHLFFRPQTLDDGGDYVLAVGQEQRDYDTLLKALSGTPLKLVVVDSSPWSTHVTNLSPGKGVTVLKNISYVALRSLYAGARLVVTPLRPVNYAAGANAVLEAMAMAKPLIVSRTEGIRDYIIHGETGLFVPPLDDKMLQDSILSLWDDAKMQKRLGENARQIVEEKMNLDIYVNHVVRIVQESTLSPYAKHDSQEGKGLSLV